jgi:hypothetical protein
LSEIFSPLKLDKLSPFLQPAKDCQGIGGWQNQYSLALSSLKRHYYVFGAKRIVRKVNRHRMFQGVELGEVGTA